MDKTYICIHLATRSITGGGGGGDNREGANKFKRADLARTVDG